MYDGCTGNSAKVKIKEKHLSLKFGIRQVDKLNFHHQELRKLTFQALALCQRE